MKKIKKRSKFQKCPKSFLSVQTCIGTILLENFFCSVFNGLIGIFRKNQKNSKLQKCPRSYRKMCKLLLNMFCGNFLEKKNAPCSMEGRAFEKIKKKIKNFWKFQKSPKQSQKCANMFWTCFGAIFSHKLLPSVPWRAGFSRIFKKWKKFKVSKVSTRVLNMRCGDFSEFFLPSVRCSAFQIFWT